MEFTQADLTEVEIESVMDAIKNSPSFSDYRKEELLDYHKKRQVIVMRDQKELCGITAYERIHDEWVEITTVIVLPKFRGKGYGKKLWAKTVKKLSRWNICAVTFTTVLKDRLARKSKFKARSFWRLPFLLQVILVSQRLPMYKIIAFLSKKHMSLKRLEILTREKKTV